MAEGADTYRSFHDIVAEGARRWPDRVYVHCIDQGRSLTYGALNALANRIARFLEHRGFGANDRVLLLAENSVENLAVFVATLRYGATIATVHVEMNRTHLAEIIGAVNPKLVLYQDGLGLETLAGGAPGEWMALGEWAPEGGSGLFGAVAGLAGDGGPASVARPNDAGVIFYTSGTVARPKGVIQSHATAFYNYHSTADYLALGPGDRVLDFRSYSWLSAQHMSLGAPLVAGASSVMAKHFSAGRYFDWLRDYRIHIGFVVPTVVNMLIERPAAVRAADLPHLRFLTCSSAPLVEAQWRRFEDLYGITLAQSCGSSEGGNTAAHRGAARKIGTIGPAQKYQHIRIIDDGDGGDGGGADLATGETGEIVVGGGRQQALGYLMPDGAIEPLPADGHHTGDLGFIDGDGHLVITGRVKELIIRGGVNIAPLEIDGVLMAHPDIAEAGTVGVPHPIYGEEVVSFVACTPGAGPGAGLREEAILDHCRTRLPAFKMPKEIIFRDALPRNARGKLDRNALAEDWKRQHASAAAPATGGTAAYAMSLYASPSEYRSTHALIAMNAERHPDKIYAVSVDQDEKSLTYGQLRDVTNRIADYLKDSGFEKHDRLLVLAENSIEFFAAYLGTLRYGATLATVHVETNRAQLARICRAIDPRVVLYQDGLGLEGLRDGGAPGEWMALGQWAADGGGTGFFARIAGYSAANDQAPLCAADDPGVLLFTSGTTADARGVIYPHGSTFYNWDAVAGFVGLGTEDRILDFRSYSWSSAQMMSLGGPLTRGATVIMMNGFSQSRYFDWVKKYRVNIGVCVPTGFNMFIARPLGLSARDLPDLRFMTSSSAPLLVEQWKRFEDMYGIPVAQGYGVSEGGWICGSSGETRRFGTVGRPLCYQELRIADARGAALATGETGEIVIVGGRQLACCTLSADGVVEPLPKANYRTGDLGFMDADGYLTITGRVKDLIIRGGVNIAPLEIDLILSAHAEVDEAMAIGVPHDIYGEEVVAYVSLTPGAGVTAEELMAHCAAVLPEPKTPKEIIIRDSLPHNARGKLDRLILIEDWKRSHGADGPAQG